MRPVIRTCLVTILTLLLLGITPVLPVFSADAAETLTVMTHNSFSISKEVLAKFEQANNVKVRFLKSDDAGAALIQAILSRENPMADLFYGVDNTWFSRAINADIFVPYNSPILREISPILDLDPQHRLLPVDFGDVCLNIDKQWFSEHKIAPPEDLNSLLKPAYRNLTVVENPTTSSPGLAFLLITIANFGDGEAGYLDYWRKLKANGVYIADGWSDAYYGHFTAAAKAGDKGKSRPIVVSYASSPAAAAFYSDDPSAPARTAAVVSPGSAFRQIEFIGILKGTKKLELAQKFVDFALGRDFQADIPLQMFVFPANTTVNLPPIFTKNTKIAGEPAKISPQAIEENRERWLEAWTNAVLRN